MVETHRHLELKRIGVAWLLAHGAIAAAEEVGAPIPRFRLDVAGYADRPRNESDRPVTTCIIECKQARADFIRDSRERERLLRERDLLERRCAFLESTHVRNHEPHLRQSGSSLFQDLETWDYQGSRLQSYQDCLERLRRIEESLYRETKFCTIARYRLANHLFLLAPPGVVTRRELPWGWGLITCPPELLRGRPRPFDALLESAASGTWTILDHEPHNTPARFQERLLRNIAVAATRAAYGRQQTTDPQLNFFSNTPAQNPTITRHA